MELNELEELEHQGLKPRSRWSRRGFVMTSLATGFALSVQPVRALLTVAAITTASTITESVTVSQP